MFKLRPILLAASLALAAPAALAQDAEPTLVFAAASLKNALDAAVEDYSKTTGKTVTVSYAASSALAKQIEEARAGRHLLLRRPRLDGLSAGAEPDRDGLARDAARQRHRAGRAGRQRRGARHRAGLPARRGARRRQARHGADRIGAGRQIRQGGARKRSASGTASPANVAEAENVRAALALVSRGEAPLGIVYTTDAKAEPGVKVVGTFPADSHPPILYPVALTANAKPDAQAFLDYLTSAKAKPYLRGAGLPRRRARFLRPDGILAGRDRRDQAQPARRDRRDAGQPAFRDCGRADPRARPLSRAARCSTGSCTCRWCCRPVVTGYLLLIGFGRRGPIGAFLEQTFGIVFAFRWTGAALASGIMGFPLLVRAMRLSIEAVDRRLEDAAASLGAHGASSSQRSRCRSSCPGLLAGAVLDLRQGARRVRRDHHLRLEHPRRDADAFRPRSTPRCRCRAAERGAIRLSLVSIVISLGALLALRGAGAADARTDGRSLEPRRRAARTGAAISRSTSRSTAGRGRDRALRPLRAPARRRSSAWSQACARPRAGRIVLNGRTLFDSAAAHRLAGRGGASRHGVPGGAALSASLGALQPALRPLGRPAQGDDAVRPRCWRCSGSRLSSSGSRRRCPAARRSAWRSAGR